MSLLVIVRHGQSQWNLDNRFTGDVDVPLTDEGRKEALAAGKKLSNIVFDHAFTSLLTRASETLSIILNEIDQTQIPITSNGALNERNYGELQGLNKAEMAGKYGADQVATWRRSYDIQPPGGESLKDTAARVIPFYQQEIEPLIISEKNILMVAHGNSLRALMMYLENIDAATIADVNIPTGAPRIYTFSSHLKLIDALYV
jgi:2,3-bisphosphoglycerate-dependent phosphoglycerate mutase